MARLSLAGAVIHTLADNDSRKDRLLFFGMCASVMYGNREKQEYTM